MTTTSSPQELLEPRASREPAPQDAPSGQTAGMPHTAPAMVDITIPVYNEERSLESCVRRLHRHLAENFPYTYSITLADNASTDSTLAIATELSREISGVRVLHLGMKGRGHALRTAWLASQSPIVAYMDVDLSTDLNALGTLVAPLVSGHSDLAVGTRLSRTSRVVRGPKREFISRSYNLLLRGFLAAHFSDAQCGFKAIRTDVARQLLPHTLDDAWFFDTELLVLAERCGLRVHEVPVDWTDDPDSKVDIRATAVADLRGMLRISRDLVNGRIPVAELRAAMARKPLADDGAAGRHRLVGQLLRFAMVGLASTLFYVLLFLAFRLVADAQWSNFAALLLSAVANTTVNRSFTFGRTGPAGAFRHQFLGLLVFAVGWVLTAGALWGIHAVGGPNRTVEVVAVVLANLMATLVKFLAFRLWIFRTPAGTIPTAISTTAARETGK
ncbi:bifunctional glycosyltransferase family 2/GtrA family protein [Arthrobacter sp. ERGS1:01]|uniref:bifunctional glycosyltransferase family 2/GtrA family protein n=1 Tax=Arthrobacter sp. ERGS1:01 TaxID=1704044 RepID=UPI0009E685E6